jgi:hypothetical protein
MISMVPDFDDLRGRPDPLGFFSSGLLILVVFKALLVQLGSFLVLLLSRMALR